MLVLILLFGLFIFHPNLSTAHAQDTSPVVRAVLFYLPTCPHCHYVLDEVLPPLAQKYGDQLRVMTINISQPSGQTLFDAALGRFPVPDDKRGFVPTLVIGDVIMVGADQIEARLPGLIEEHLAKGGVDWPQIPGLRPDSAPLYSSTSTTTEATESNTRQIFANDPAGGLLAFAILVGMFFALGWVVISLFGGQRSLLITQNARPWLTPLLCVIGLGVAGYLTYIEMTQTTAVCGPVGDCNTVQQSEYARLFGILPVGLLGLAGYVLILVAHAARNYAPEKWRRAASQGLLGMALFGVVFSIYLTYLEIFVIQAVCLWCLSSAVISTLLLLLATEASPKRARLRDRRVRVERKPGIPHTP